MIYLLFSFHQYYPGGGMGDCEGIYSTINDAKAAWERKEDRGSPDYVEIVKIEGLEWDVASTYEYNGWEDRAEATND